MNTKIITVVAVALAVIAAAVAAIVVSSRRADEAWAYAEAEKSSARAAEEAAKAEKAKAAAETSKQMAKADEAKASAAKVEAEKIARETARVEAAAAADQRAAAEANAVAEKAKAEAARLAREAAKVTNETARVELQKAKVRAAEEESRAEAEAAKLAAAKLNSERIIAEAELRKREYDHLVQWSQDLADRERDVAEREQALQPERTIADLSWAGGNEDTIIDDKGNIRKYVKPVYSPETDPLLPEESRRLARTERLVRQAHTNQAAAVRSSLISSMERLYVQAVRDGRVIDAEHYKQNILQMYPDWKFKVSD